MLDKLAKISTQFFKIQIIITKQFPGLMRLRQREQIQHSDIEELHQFLRSNVFGDENTNAGPLTAEEEDQLFNLLDNVHKCQGIVVRGIWPILSLSFQNRSGLVLMNMFYNSNVKMEEIFHKKTFIKDIQSLQNGHLTWQNFNKIVSALKMQVIFEQKFNQFRKEMKKFRQYRKSPIILLDQQKILEENGYDSEPELHFYDNMLDEKLYPNQSLLFYQKQFDQQERQSNDHQQEQTVTIKRRIRQQRLNTTQKKRRKRQKKLKKSKRANKKIKKQRMLTQTKRARQKFDKLSKQIWKEQRELRKKYSWLTEECFQNLREVREGQRKNAPVRQQEQQERDEINQQYRQLEAESQLYLQSNLESERKIQRRNRRHRRLRKNNNFEQILENSQGVQEIFQNIQEPQIMEQCTLYNESISNLKIIEIKFPSSLEKMAQALQQNMNEEYAFNFEGWKQLVRASTYSKKQTMKFIKQLLKRKQTRKQISLQHILKLLCIVKIDSVQDYVKQYFEPMLVFSMSQMILNIIGELVQILYTSNNSYSISSLFKHCSELMKIQQDQNQNLKAVDYIYKSLKAIYEDFWGQNNVSSSNISFESYKQLLLNNIRIKLSDSDLRQTVLIALLILTHGFLMYFQGFDPNIIYESFLKTAVQKNLQSNPHFLKHLSTVYFEYHLSIKTKQDYGKTMELVQSINLNNKDKNVLIMIADFVTMITSLYIRKRVDDSRQQQQQKLNSMPIINTIQTNNFISRFSKQHTQMKVQITINYYAKMLEYKELESEKFINHIIKDISRPEYYDNVSIELINLLAKIYRLGPQRKEKQRIDIDILKQTIKKKLHLILNKIMDFSHKSFYGASEDKIKKFCSLLELVFDQIVSFQVVDEQTYQFTMMKHSYSLDLVITCICPVLFNLPKCNQFIMSLGEKCLNVVYATEAVISEIKKSYKKMADNILDEEDKLDLLYKKQEKIKEYYRLIVKIINQSEIGKKISQSYTNIKASSQNIFYQLYGAINALICQDEQTFNQIKAQFSRELTHHSKQIKNEVNRQTKTTNKFILQFLKGFFNVTTLLQSNMHSNTIERLQSKMKDDILNILFLRLVCEKQNKVIEIIRSAIICQGFEKCRYILLNLPIKSLENLAESQSSTDLEFVLNILLRSKQNFLNKFSFIQFRKSNLQAFMSLYRQCSSQERKQTIAFLSYNLLSIFIFLIKCNSNDTLIKEYSPYFSINELSLNQSILKNICIQENSRYSCEFLLIELFKEIQKKKKINLTKLCTSYYEYLMTAEINLFRQNRDYGFNKINLILKAFNNCGQFSKNKQFTDPSTYKICKLLLNTFFQYGFIYEKFAVINLFFTLFKSYPLLKQVLCNVFEENFDRINRTLNQNLKQNDDEPASIESKIMKYIINPQSNFEQLYQILEKCKKSKLNSNKSNKFNQLIVLTDKCLRVLHQSSGKNIEIVNKFNEFKANLVQICKQNNPFWSQVRIDDFEERKASRDFY